MSRPKYWWHANVCRTISAYPDLLRRVRDMRSQKITPAYAAAPKAAGDGRTVESAAMRILTSREYSDYEAIKKTLEEAAAWTDGSLIIEVVATHAWNDRLRFDETGRKLFISTATAKRMYRRFVYAAAQNLGYQTN